MGDRISISFSATYNDDNHVVVGSKDNTWKRESAVLSSHWSGMGLVEMALDFIQKLQEIQKNEGITEKDEFNPLDRFEPDNVMINFIRMLPYKSDYDRLSKYGMISSDFRIVKDESDTDNSDNGHYEIDLSECKKGKKPKVLQGNEVVRVLA